MLYAWAADSGTGNHGPGEEKLGDGAWWYAREGGSIPFTTLSFLSAPSAEKAEAKTFYIICLNHSVSLNGNVFP